MTRDTVDDLRQALFDAAPDGGSEFLTAFMRHLLDAHAHELAERIRTDARARHARDFSDNRVFRLAGAEVAADLIDPEVTE